MLPLRRALLAALAALAAGCATPQYLIQAGVGQLDMSLRARPLRDAIDDPDVDPRVRALLAEVPAVKRFGEEHGLTPTKSYEAFSDLKRSSAVWVVSASAPLAFKSKTWWFPIVGRVPYLGFFNKGDAERLADYLRDEGLDVDLRGASAYSTIGWFKDPVLSTMIPKGDEALGNLVDVVLHESVHATVYIPGQAAFNESVASFVADGLALVYLDRIRGPESKERAAYLSAEASGDKRHKAMHAAYEKLQKLYASELPDAVKLEQKAILLRALEIEVGARRPINNAVLAEMKTYDASPKDFDALLAACGGSYARFLGALKTLTPASFRGAVDKDLGHAIRPLVAAGCPAPPAATR